MASIQHDVVYLRTLSRSLARRFALSSWKTHAGVSLDRMCYDHDSPSPLPPHGRRLADDMGLCVDDEFMATCPSESVFWSEGIAHAEAQVLTWLRGRINTSKWPPVDDNWHTIHLFTRFSPCSGCIPKLEDLLRLLLEKGLMGRVRLVLGYTDEYIPWKPGTPLAQRTFSGPDVTIPWLYRLQKKWYPNFRVVKIYQH